MSVSPSGDDLFGEAVLLDQNTVIFPPMAANCVGFFYVDQKNFECKPFLPELDDPAITEHFATVAALNDGTALFPPLVSGCVGRLGPPITIVEQDLVVRPNKSSKSNPLPAPVVAFIVITSLLATAGIAIWAGPHIYNRCRSYTALPQEIMF